MKAKIFRVSLACMIPHNFECEVEALSELNAFRKGRELFYSGKEGEIQEVLPAVPVLDLSNPDNDDEIPNGAQVEEVGQD